MRDDGSKVEPAPHDLSPEVDHGGLKDILGFHIRLAQGAVYRHFMETFGHLDLTQMQVSVLWLVNGHPGIAQTDLSQRLRMDRATTMGIVNKLQSRGFLVRSRSQSDARKQDLHLVAKGEAVLAEACTAIRIHEGWLKSRFTPREVTRLTNLLAKIHE